jgi:DNA-binding transcriptional MerR regulator
MRIYKPHEFGKLINRTTSTLQRWDRDGHLVAQRTPTNRRYYTHDQYLAFIGQKGITAFNRGRSTPAFNKL